MLGFIQVLKKSASLPQLLKVSEIDVLSGLLLICGSYFLGKSKQPGSQFVVKFDKKRWIEFVTQFNLELNKWESYSKHIDHSLGYIRTTFKDHNVSPSCPKCLSNESQFESLNVGELVHSLVDAMRTTIYWREWLKSMVDEAIFLRDLASTLSKMTLGWILICIILDQNGLSPTHSVSNLSDQLHSI